MNKYKQAFQLRIKDFIEKHLFIFSNFYYLTFYLLIVVVGDIYFLNRIDKAKKPPWSTLNA